MWALCKKILRSGNQHQLRKEYMKLRLDAMEAQKAGDVKRSMVLNARADRMIDQVIYS